MILIKLMLLYKYKLNTINISHFKILRIVKSLKLELIKIIKYIEF